jgi:hypothetical protein
LAMEMLQGRLSDGSSILCDVEEGNIVFQSNRTIGADN